MLSLLTTLCLLGLPLATSTGGEDVSGGVTLTLEMEAFARGTEVEVGEIAQIVADDATLVTLVAAVELGYSPAPGYSRVFRIDRIAAAIRKELPNVQVSFRGQKAVRVHPDVERIPGDTVLAEARGMLEREFSGQDISFMPAARIEPIEIPAGTNKHEVRARLDDLPDASRVFSVPVEILVDGVRYRTIWTTWDVSIYETRPVLARAVRAGEVLEPSMFERRRVVRKAGESAGLEAHLLPGSVALHDLVPGQLVTALDVQRPTVIQFGETVALRVRKGVIEAKVYAVALQAGSIGDRIKVQTNDSSQELVATIVSRELCTIDLGK